MYELTTSLTNKCNTHNFPKSHEVKATRLEYNKMNTFLEKSKPLSL